MTEKRVQELLGQMQKTLECSICLEMMSNPVSTGCGHQFCRFCLMKLFERERLVHCPLCKKQVTKRSLMKREQLGGMIESVRTLISAFQKDTGVLFSPPRGLQASLLPGTPDVIQAKSSVVKKHGKETRRSNVRRSTRQQPVESEPEISVSTTDSPERIPNDRNVGHTCNSGSGKRRTRNKIKNTPKTETRADGRELELLKCIEKGRHHADETVEDNAVKQSESNSLNSPADVDNSCKALEIKLTDCAHDNNLGTVPNLTPCNVTEKVSMEVNENIVVDKKAVAMTLATGSVKDVDLDIPVLSGNSVAKESEISSGPLFKTPIDPKSFKNSDKKSVSESYQDTDSKKSLRSRNKKLNYDENVENDEDSSVKLTPEVLVVKESAVSRTYSRKDKDCFSKEKKANKKVAEWLKNIPSAAESRNSEMNDLKDIHKLKKLRKKNVKVAEEEKAMGNKMRSLAKQIQDNGRGLLFDSCDFESKENASSGTGASLTSDSEDIKGVSEVDKGEIKELNGDSEKINNKTEENEFGITKTDAVNDSNVEKQNYVNESIAGNIETEVEVAKNLVRKKRIFKSRTGQVMQSSKESVLNKTAVAAVTTAQSDVSKPELVSDSIDTEIAKIKSQQLQSIPESFDPYEFKSSQNTPKKIIKKKSKQKKNGKLTQTNKKKGKQEVTERQSEVNKSKVESEVNKKFEKMWDKDLVPDKTILKVKAAEEIDKVSASLQQAEDYDLLTCTQDAADSIAREEEKHSSMAFNEVDRETVTSAKLVCAQKKVRFTEPVISDFVQVGKVDIIGYRKAREQFAAVHTETEGKRDYKERRKDAEAKCAEKENTGTNRENNLTENVSHANEDKESDDLSEDYRFHDDSSGTDDLDIEPTPEQFEKPDLEIQPEEIKSQLSQMGPDIVQETPLILINKESPNVQVIEETPAVLSGPKFNKILSKPTGKLKKPRNVTKFSAESGKKAVTKTSETITSESKEPIAAVSVKDVEIAPEKNNESRSTVLRQEKLSGNVYKETSKLPVDSDETESPSVEVNLTQDVNMNEAEVNNVKRQFDSDQEIPEASIKEALSSESALTQNSESLLYPKCSVVTSRGRNDVNEQRPSTGAAAETDMKTHLSEKDDMSSQQLSERRDSDGSVKILGESVNKKQQKKKRKSFMLEEAEESLDFGSLNESAVVTVDEDSEIVSRAKRQRVNRLRRSPKNKEIVVTRKSADDVYGSEKDGNGPEEVCVVNIEDSDSVEMIPDTVVSDSAMSASIKPVASIDIVSAEIDQINQGVRKIHNSPKGMKQKKKSKESVCDTSLSSNDVLNSQFVSDETVSNSTIVTKKKGKSMKMLRSIKDIGFDHQESEQRSVCDSLDTVDVIGETEMSNTEDVTKNEMREKFKKPNENESCIKTSYKHKYSNCVRSPSLEKKKMQHSETDLNSTMEEDISKVRHLSGMLNSPQESFVLTGEKDSPEDIFQIDSEMPSVDLSPEEETLRPCSQSLDLGTLASLEPVDHLELTSNEKKEAVTNEDAYNAEVLTERIRPESHNLIPRNNKKTELDLDIDSSPEETRRRSKVKAVRGFSKIKRMSNNGKSSLSLSDSMSSVIQDTLEPVSSVKSKSPVAKFLSPIRSKKHSNSPAVEVRETNVPKYSPSTKKNKNDIEEKYPNELESEIVELENHADKEEEDILVSPNYLPDLDNRTDKDTSVNVNFDPINCDVERNTVENDKLPKISKVSPKFLLKSPDKEMNVVSHRDDDDEVEKNDIKTNISDVDEVCENEMSLQLSKEEPNKNPAISELQKLQSSVEVASEDESSMHSSNSSTSSEFRLDSSDEEESLKKQAFTEITKFDKIVEDSIEFESLSDRQRGMDSISTGTNSKRGKPEKEAESKSIEKRSVKLTKKHFHPSDGHKDETVTRKVSTVDYENMYSTKLDSSPSVNDDVNLDGDSEAVVLESDLDDDDDEEEHANKNEKGKSGKDSYDSGTKSEMINSDTDQMQDDDDDDDDDDAVVRRKGVKRAIISDSSSEDEDDDSRQWSMNSSSAFSSQSENLTTQERYALQKEVDKMARNLETMKEQLRKSKELKRSKKSESKSSPKPVTIDDSEEDIIEADLSDMDEDIFMSQPAICPSDLQAEDEGTRNLTDALHVPDDAVEPDECKDVNESATMPPDSLTVLESDPSQLSRQALADIDTNIPQLGNSGKKRHVGIVVTGLNQQQIQQTKKLAALNDAKFFTKFNDQVTHVVVKPADEDETVCDRTLKFFQGISRRCWIVNFFWVVDSREVGHLLPEDPYEIQGDTANNEAHHGPRRARQSKDILFCKFQFSLIGDNTYLSKESLKDLIEACGGDVLDIAHLGQGHRKSLVISCTDIDEDEEEQHFITKHARDLYKGLGIVMLSREWILDSLTLYRTQPLKDYVITDVPGVKIAEL